MNPAIYEQLVETLRREPLPLEKLHALAVDAGSTWSVEQLHLLLACMDGIEVQSDDAGSPMIKLGQRSQQDELAEAIAEVVRAQGRPVPAAQVMQLLPRRFTTSVEQIKKMARETSGLRLLGPGLVALE
jgi:nucleotide-binding universal stress UspA family protein